MGLRLSELMRSAASTDPEQAQEVISEFKDWLENNLFGLTKIGGHAMTREAQAALRRVTNLDEMLSMRDEVSPFDEDQT